MASALGLTRVQCAYSDDVRGEDHLNSASGQALALDAVGLVQFGMKCCLHCTAHTPAPKVAVGKYVARRGAAHQLSVFSV